MQNPVQGPLKAFSRLERLNYWGVIAVYTLLAFHLLMHIRMDNTMNKASISLLAMATLVIAAIAAKIRATAEAQAPEGYEDATGFHFGSPNFEE